MKVKLIIATTKVDTVYFNYGDDYSDITRVLVEDHGAREGGTKERRGNVFLL